jgi:hypothetical protein
MELLDAYELVRFAPTFRDRLERARDRLDKGPDLAAERGWIDAALERVAAADPGQALLERVRELPELTDVRADFAEAQQNAWVDALEKLLAGITFHAGSRSPLIEALFASQKLPALRRASLETAAPFAAELDRKLKTSYVTRILAQEEFAFAPPVLEQIERAWAGWQACFIPSTLSEEDAAPLRQALLDAASGLDRAIRQARLLAEAALLPLDGAFEEEALHQKPRRRAPKVQPPRPAPAAEPAPAPAAKKRAARS